MFRDSIVKELLAPEVVAPSSGGSQPESESLSLEDLLNADDKNTAETEEAEEIDPSLTGLDEEVEDESDEDDSEESEEEPEEDTEKPEKKEEPEEELKLNEDEDLDIAQIPTRAQIKAKYPNIFKEFKFLDKVIYREAEFAKQFPTVADAKQARETVSNYKEFQDDLLSGNTENLLRSVKRVDEKAFTKIATGFLDTLTKVDPNAHVHITAQVTKGILNQLNTVAKRALVENPGSKEAEQLELATEIIHNAIWNTRKVTPLVQPQEQQEHPEVKQIREERTRLHNEKFTSALSDVGSSTESFTKKVVEANIDTKNILPVYVKNKLTEDVINEVRRQITGDDRLMNFMGRHWEQAKKDGFSQGSLDKIKTAMKNHVKSLLPGIIKLKKGEAIRGLQTKRTVTRELPKKSEERAPRNGNRPVTNNRKESDRLIPREGESVADFLARD